jgi:hypothetical protein
MMNHPLKNLWKHWADKESRDIWKSCRLDEEYKKAAMNEVNNMGQK